MATVQDIDDSTAASLVLYALSKSAGKKATRKGGFLNLSTRAAFDIIVKRVPGVDEKFACFTFYAVKGGKARSSTAVFTQIAVTEVLKQLFDHALESLSPTYSMAKTFSDALKSGSIDTKDIYSKAAKLGGAMQLHAARGMGQDAYDQCRIFGLSANVQYGGAVRFEIKVDAGKKFLEIHLRAWHGLSDSAPWVDRFTEDGRSRFPKIHTYGGPRKGDYVYRAGVGELEDIA